MVFNSFAFFAFFIVAAIVYWLLPGKYRWLWLLAASTFFYAYAQPQYLPVPFAIAIVGYYAGLAIEKAASENKKKKIFIAAAAAIIATLVFFKYTNFFGSFFTGAVNFISGKLFHSQYIAPGSLFIDIAAPLGISYITFQAIGYLIEIKRGNEKAEKHFGHFASYLLLFTKIIAGPVERAHHFLPQLKASFKFNYGNITSGARQMLWGLFKKIVVADRLSIYVDAAYNNYEHHSGITLLFASFCYAFQIYADFSGYTDMALGFSRMLGLELMPNFNRPFLAKSVTEFWRRWHMSLSTWFADYFYSPLAMAKRDWGKWAAIFASFVTFTVLGFWHGPNWVFVVFGALQGAMLSIELLTRKQRKNMRKKIPQWLNDTAGTFFTVSFFGFSSIFFRSASVEDALNVTGRIARFNGALFYDSISTLLLIVLGLLYILLHDVKAEFFDNRFSLSQSRYWLVRNGYYCVLIIILLATGVFDGGEFIYFQF